MRKTKTISIPPALETEMAKFKENWSAVACRAFEIRIEELKATDSKDKSRDAERITISVTYPRWKLAELLKQ